MIKIGIIGTAGRDKSQPMTRALWDWMLADAQRRVPVGAHVVSGGAAWADHLAIVLFLRNHASALTLYLPAPFQNGLFRGPAGSSATAANYYHRQFSDVVGFNTLHQIGQVSSMDNVHGGFEPAQEGYRGMFARNTKVVADLDGLLAYTFGLGDAPADGGTMDTWNKAKCGKTHVSLLDFHG